MLHTFAFGNDMAVQYLYLGGSTTVFMCSDCLYGLLTCSTRVVVLVWLSCDFQDTHTTDERRDLRDRLTESERSMRVMRQRELRALERCDSLQKGITTLHAKMDETQVSTRQR